MREKTPRFADVFTAQAVTLKTPKSLEAVLKLIKVVIGEALSESSQSESSFRWFWSIAHNLLIIADDY